MRKRTLHPVASQPRTKNPSKAFYICTIFQDLPVQKCSTSLFHFLGTPRNSQAKVQKHIWAQNCSGGPGLQIQPWPHLCCARFCIEKYDLPTNLLGASKIAKQNHLDTGLKRVAATSESFKRQYCCMFRSSCSCALLF